MSYELIAKQDWAAFVEAFSNRLEGRQVELEIVGLDLGDQIEAEWLPLHALRFGERAGRLHVQLQQGGTVDHAIEAVEIWAEISGGELSSLVVIDTSGHKQILRFRAPLGLPTPIGRPDGGGASPA
jgi:hypothetical protein